METKHCNHIPTDVEIDRDFLKVKDGLKSLKCLGNFFLFSEFFCVACVCLSHSLALREPDEESKRGRRGHLISNTSEYLYEKTNESSNFWPMSVLYEHQTELQSDDI